MLISIEKVGGGRGVGGVEEQEGETRRRLQEGCIDLGHIPNLWKND